VGALVGGVGSRIAMRISAIMATEAEQGTLTDADQVVGDMTLGRTLVLIVFGGLLTGMAGGLMYSGARRWLADARQLRGLAFGALLLVSTGWSVIERDNPDFAALGSVTANVTMFAIIFLAFGVFDRAQ